MSGRGIERGTSWSACVILATLAISGCGDDDRDELLSRLPADATFVAYSDLDAVRSDLGMPEDADPADVAASPDLARAAVGLQALVGADDLETPPALGLDAADAVASSSVPETAVVISTSAEGDEVAAALEEAGYEEESEDLLVREGRAVALSDGLIGVAETAAAAEALVGEPEGEPPAPFEEDLEGPVISSVAVDPEAECLAYVVSIDEPKADGELAFFPIEEPDVANVNASPDPRFGEPRVEGDSVRVDVGLDAEEAPSMNVLPAYDALRLLEVNYECAGG